MQSSAWTDAPAFRQNLHRHPERSGAESGTATRLVEALTPTTPGEILTGLGGHGVAAIYRAQQDGPRILVRADMDALPINETTDLPHRSTVPGTSHKCGHDGHMTMLMGLAHRLNAQPPERGEVVLLFQPAEETGQGAAAVMADERWPRIDPDISIGLHNLPGFPLGAVVMRDGPFASASVGLAVSLRGATSHAAEPHRGRSPAHAVAALINAFAATPQTQTGLAEAAKVTVIHARVGEIAFGTTPGEGEVMATLRSHRSDVLERLKERCTEMARGVAATYDLKVDLEWREEFPATVSEPGLAALVREVAGELGRPVVEREFPFAWSEDFGHFTQDGRRAVFFGLGSGVDHPALHHPDYDFPDEILPHGTAMFEAVLRRLLNDNA